MCIMQYVGCDVECVGMGLNGSVFDICLSHPISLGTRPGPQAHPGAAPGEAGPEITGRRAESGERPL